MVYERLHGPIGGRRDDFLAATIAATVANSLSQKEIPFGHFLPDWPELIKEAEDGIDVGPEPFDQDLGYGED